MYFETQSTSGTSPCTGICAVQDSQTNPKLQLRLKNSHSCSQSGNEDNMDHSESTNRDVSAPVEKRAAAKKLYMKPEVRYERVFETMALACGKVQTTQFSCHANRKAS